jgi:hypothetical protein
MALALAAVLSTSAQAQTTSYSEGDLLLGFEQQNGSGGVTANDFVVDLGSASNFIGATGPLTFDLSTTNLTSAFGSNWASNSATDLVQWGVVGGSDLNSPITVGSDTLQKNTLFYTEGELNVGTHSTPPATASNSTQKTINTNIQNFANDFAGQTESTSGLNAVIIGSNDSLGWSANNPSTAAFGSSHGIEEPSSGSYTGPTDSVLDLYQLNNTTTTPGSTATLLGEFSLSSGGVLTFDQAGAVPEPSSYALVGVGAMFLFWRLRRKAAYSL